MYFSVQRFIDYVGIAERSSAYGIYNQNTVDDNGHFELLYAKISRKRYLMWPGLILVINRKSHIGCSC